MTLGLISETSAVDVAWEAFDVAAIVLQGMYRNEDGPSRVRQEQALKVAKLWREFLDLASRSDQTRPAA